MGQKFTKPHSCNIVQFWACLGIFFLSCRGVVCQNAQTRLWFFNLAPLKSWETSAPVCHLRPSHLLCRHQSTSNAAALLGVPCFAKPPAAYIYIAWSLESQKCQWSSHSAQHLNWEVLVMGLVGRWGWGEVLSLVFYS